METLPAVRTRDLRKTYIISEREAGVRAALRSLVHRPKKEVRAVDGISFELAPGEIVGFLGPLGPTSSPSAGDDRRFDRLLHVAFWDEPFMILLRIIERG
ncbi:MAG: hypothetical protein Q8O91_10235 [Candidatus Aminicenantes bacterium]|nr:hypothetical protein [Candidatus Aminicenantes bacterium]